MNLVCAITFLGDCFSLYIAELMINVLGLDWTIFIVTFSFLLFTSIMLVHRVVEEYPVQSQPTSSFSEFLADKVENMKLILHHSKRAVAVVENVLVVGLYYNMLLWFPYYFTSIGYASHATNLSVISSFMMFFGCLVFESVARLCPNYCHWVISALLIGAAGIQFQMISLVNEPS